MNKEPYNLIPILVCILVLFCLIYMEIKNILFNVGMLGHVAHGKTSLTRALSGVTTTKFSQEKIRNITIKLGYANFKIFKVCLLVSQ